MSTNRHDARLAIKVTPNAGRNTIVGLKDGFLYVKIAAPPEKGKANKELIDFLAEKLAIKKSAILIVKGQTSRYKSIIVEGIGGDEALKLLTA